ncbi:MAG TPA: ABC transporter permease [Actinopolymorphaceae bacterium]
MYTQLLTVEAKLFLRDKAALLITLLIPLALVAGFGMIPGFGDPSSDLGGQAGTEFIASMGVALVIVLLGFQVLPVTLATYREKGILRRLGTTPASPVAVLAAQLVIYAVVAVVSAALVVGVAVLGFGQATPRSLAWLVGVFVLGFAAACGIGLIIGAVAPTAKAGTGLAMLLFFPSLFLGGVYFPREAMPPLMQQICDLTPLGAAFASIRHAWQGTSVEVLHLGVLAAWAIVANLVAAKVFRWE